MHATAITFSDFSLAFERRGRLGQFSHEALHALFDHLMEIGMQGEFDVIALCCEYAEMRTEELDEYSELIARFPTGYSLCRVY